jgi:signal transduction histidine kinase
MGDKVGAHEELPAALSFLAGGGEVGRLLRAYDWSTTPLGPPAGWPQSLKTAVRIMLTSRQPIWVGWGPELTYLYNDPYLSIIGGKHPHMLGKPVAEVWHEIWADIGPLLQEAMNGESGTYSEEQLLIMERNGYPEETYYTFSYSPIPNDDGAPGGIICANTDDTQRVIGERQLALLRELATETVDARSWRDACERSMAALADGRRDLPFAVLYMAEPQSTVLERISQTGFAEGLRLPDAPFADWPVETALREHRVIVVDGLPARIADNLAPGVWERKPDKIALIPIIAKGDAARSGLLVVGLNPHRLLDEHYRGFLNLIAGQIAAAITSADAYEQERRRSEALAELDRAKTAFFSNVSHEFRTPLTLMLGPLEDVLAKPDLPDDVRLQTETAHRNGTRLLRLVNSLLDFSRIEAGRVQATYVATDLASFTTDIASSFRSAIERAGLTLTVDTGPDAAMIYVDRDMWEKVILNLLSNALKFTFEGAISLQMRQEPDGGHVVVTVADTGIGIAAEELPRLFERFHRVEGARGRSFEGSGIGLALVQELVRLHGGDISAASTPGVGTAFTIRLPAGRAHLPADRVLEVSDDPAVGVRVQEFVEEALRWQPDARDTSPFSVVEGLGSASSPAGAGAGRGKHIILADDNVDMRDYVRRLLQAHGYVVEAFGNGAQALEVARTAAPDLVLTDVMMPELDGFGLLRAIRNDPQLASVPVIVLSARAGEEAKVEGLEAGADDYLIKPFAARELIARVNANIQMSDVRREAMRAILQSEQKMLLSEDRLKAALATGRVAVYEWEITGDEVTVLGPLSEVWGLTEDEATSGGLPLSRFIERIHPDDRAHVLAAINRSIETGAAFEAEYRVTGSESGRYLMARGSMTASQGRQRMVGALFDITERKAIEEALEEHRQALEEQTSALQILNRAASAISGDLDLERLVQNVVDAAVELTGAEFGAFFYNSIVENGQIYSLYTLSGAHRDAFAEFPMPRVTPVFAPTFAGTHVVRYDDVLTAPDYGLSPPFSGMPKGHLPVRSYLAVPVKSRSGAVLGGLLFGHSKPGVFDPLAEERLVGLAAQAAVAIDNAQLFQAAERELHRRRAAEAELQALNATLEDRVTAEIAERAKAEEALRQAQKMEAVGQLTGGVAHDFNNLLTVIMGGLDTIKRSNPADQVRIRRAADMALLGAQRAAGLTARLLAFSRRQPLEPKPLDLNTLVRDMTDLMHRTLGEHIELEGVLAPRLWVIEADQNQLENALLNLAVNARDAMPEGGKLTIETANTALDENYVAQDAEVISGQYVVVAVSDTGSGMSKATLSRVFEPFFTTKEVGRGTGLGLSMVYGFVKQSGGHVTIYSEIGQGTTVKLYFPRYLGGLADADAVIEASIPEASDGEVILVVEDNHEVRAYSVMILTELGYRVIEVSDGDQAIEVLRGPQRIDLLFTDVVLPGKSGRVIADEAKSLRPNLSVLFTTGYSRNAIVHHGRLDPGVQLISKPFTFEQLAQRVRDTIDQGG